MTRAIRCPGHNGNGSRSVHGAKTPGFPRSSSGFSLKASRSGKASQLGAPPLYLRGASIAGLATGGRTVAVRATGRRFSLLACPCGKRHEPPPARPGEAACARSRARNVGNAKSRLQRAPVIAFRAVAERQGGRVIGQTSDFGFRTSDFVQGSAECLLRLRLLSALPAPNGRKCIA
jgi:hypothetical protein